MKEKSHHYNPLGSAFFRQHQFAAVLASDVSYNLQKLLSICLESCFPKTNCVVITDI
jgi:hypothetical protein